MKQRGWFLLAVVVAIGVLLRLVQLMSRQSLWGDEAYLLLNLRDIEWFQAPFRHLGRVEALFGVQAGTQAAPPVFLMAIGAVLRLSPDERVLRLIPFLCSSAAVGCMAAIGTRLVPLRIAAIVTLLMAASPVCIFQAATVKQYSVELCAATVLILIAIRELTSPARPRLQWRFCLLGAALIWIAYSSVFITVPAILGMWIAEEQRRGKPSPQSFGRLFAKLLPLAFSLSVLWVATLRVQQDGYLTEFWSDAFAPWDRPAVVPIWLGGQILGIFGYLQPLGGLLLIAAASGVWQLIRQRRYGLLTLLVGPFVLLIFTAMLHLYPMATKRLSLFLMPAELSLVGIGLHCFRQADRPWRWVAAGVTMPVIALTSITGLKGIYSPQNRGEFRQVVEYVQQSNEPSKWLLTTDLESSALLEWYWPQTAHAACLSKLLETREIPNDVFWFVCTQEPGENQFGRTARAFVAEWNNRVDWTSSKTLPGGLALKIMNHLKIVDKNS